MNKSNRLCYMDISKGLGILVIILGHSNNMFYKYVYPFHVPLFFLISGYFLNTNEPLKKYIPQKARKLLVPYFFTCAIVTIEYTLISLVNHKNYIYTFFSYTISTIYVSGSKLTKTPPFIHQIIGLWFLFALFDAILLIKFLSNKKYKITILVILIALSIISSYFFWLPFSIQAGIVGSAYVYIGSSLRNKIKFNNRIIAILGVLIYFIEIATNTYVSIVRNYFGAYGLSAIGALFIAYSVIFFCKIIEKNSICKTFFSYLGQNTLPILCFHSIEITAFHFGSFNIVFDVLLLMIFPILCVYIIRNTRIFKFLFS